MVDSLWIKKNGVIFVYKTAALIIDGSRVLLQRQGAEDDWGLPGGKVKMGEESGAALRRVLAEALGQEAVLDQLLCVAEDCFEAQGQQRHELGLYYLAHLLPDSSWLKSDGPFRVANKLPDGAAQISEFCWFPYDPGQVSGKLGTKIWSVSGTIKIKA
jgi:ADP-ribose pyrophosphatase YjhB (NUDIX family)